MAEFITHPRRSLYYWCLPPMALYIPSVKNRVPPVHMTRMEKNPSPSPYGGMSILTMLEKLGLHLWEVMKKVIHHCVNAAELLNATTFFMCAKDTMTMKGESEKSIVGLEAQERPGMVVKDTESQPASCSNIMRLSPQINIIKDPMMKSALLDVNGDEVGLSDWLEWESDEEEDEGCGDDSIDDDDDESEDKEEQLSPDKEEAKWSDEEESDWSDDEEDTEASVESTELWESFLNNDAYNPLYSSCSTGIKTRPADNTQLQNCTTSNPSKVKKSGDVEEHCSKENTKERTKKVSFSEKVIVHNLVAWGFASRKARDGSCWLQLARDRERFRRRVERTREIISPCLTSQHRAKAWDRLQKGPQSEQC